MACSSFHAGYLPTTWFPASLINLLSVIRSSTTGRTLTPQFTRRLVAYGQKCLDLAGICHNPYTLLCAVLRQLGGWSSGTVRVSWVLQSHLLLKPVASDQRGCQRARHRYALMNKEILRNAICSQYWNLVFLKAPSLSDIH